MELSKTEIFLITVTREFDFLRKYGYECTAMAISGRDPFITFTNSKLNRTIFLTYLGKFDLQISTNTRRFLIVHQDYITLDQLLSLSGFMFNSYVNDEDKIKWVANILQTRFLEVITGKKWKDEFVKSNGAA